MIKHIALFLLLAIASLGQAQSTPTKPHTQPAPSSGAANTQLLVYRNALKCLDYFTAIVALNNLVVIESKTGKYQDSLAYLYHAAGNYYQALYWCDEVLKKQETYVGMLEVKANCLRQTEQFVKSIEVYESLVKITHSAVYAFNLTELQYQIKRLYECAATAQMIESMEIPKDMYYSYVIGQNTTFRTPLLAATLNYKGLALQELGNPEMAKKAYEAALSVDSTFILAKNNLQKLAVSTDQKEEIKAPSDNGVSPDKATLKKD